MIDNEQQRDRQEEAYNRATMEEEQDPPQRLHSVEQLAVFLGGSGDSFTGLLLRLIAKADWSNKIRLSIAFPVEVQVYEMWQAHEPAPTWDELRAAVDRTFIAVAAATYNRTHAAW